MWKSKKEQEIAAYRDVSNVHDLPDSQIYVSQAFLAPLLRDRIGFNDYPTMVEEHVRRAQERRGEPARVASLGAGNCETEIAVAQKLGCKVDCFELNPHMLGRARQTAQDRGLSALMSFHETDLNEARLPGTYDVFLAEHSLHHVVALEHLFDEVDRTMDPHGVFLINDMVGRDGHMFYPNTLDLVQRIWATLPRDLKLDRQKNRHVPRRTQLDFSRHGFEGVRAGDILPELDRRFKFKEFGSFYAITTKFLDREFGHNFDVTRPRDKAIVDHLWHQDDFALTSKILRPTQMISAVVKKGADVKTRFTYFEHPREIFELDDARYWHVYDRQPLATRVVASVAGVPAAISGVGPIDYAWGLWASRGR
jgi:SAM-dependent methyltransferase